MSLNELKEHQHVVPRFYLKQFSEEVEKDNFQIYCLYKLVNSKPFRTNIKNVAVKNFFYDRFPPQPIETYLSIKESQLSRTYHRIIERSSVNNITKLERKHLTYLIYFQYIRTESQRKKIIMLMRDLFNEFKSDFEKKYNERQMRELKDILFKRDKIYQNYLIVLKRDYLTNPSIKFDKNILRILLSLKIKVLNHLNSLDLILFKITENNLFFFTSDSPVIYYNQNAFADKEGIPIFNIYDKFTRVYYPLTPKLCLMLYNNQIFNLTKISSNKEIILTSQDVEEINFINTLVIHESYRFIFSKYEDFQFAIDLLQKNPSYYNLNRRRHKKF